jgi:hypothetical protein
MTSQVKIDVYAAGKASGETYSLHVLPFEVELYSKVDHVGSRNSYKFNYNNKRRVIQVNSLADIDVEPCPQVLVESKMRSIYKHNQFEISVRVLENIEKSFNCDLKIKSKAHSLSLKLNYDHEDRETPAGHYDEKISESSLRISKPESIRNEKIESVEPLSQPRNVPKPQKSDQKSASWMTSIIGMVIAMLIALTVFE